MAPFTNEPWLKDDKLIIGIDIGTTFTAVSYAHLYRNGPKEVVRVGKWPGLPDQRGLTKIPSLVWYSKKQEAVKFGAEAESADTLDDAEDGGWELARHFKLHLHPYELRTKDNLETQKLPRNVAVEQVYADLLGYLTSHTREFFVARTTNGKSIWNNLIETASIVLTHPNAWGVKEQAVLRRAAVQADLVSKFNSSRIEFVTEGEASVHYCIHHGNLAQLLQPGTRFLVCDAGGSTVDTTSYIVKSSTPDLILDEAKSSGCIQAGGIFVNQQASSYLRSSLSKSPSVSQDALKEWMTAALDEFETVLKPEFPRSNGRYTLRIDRASVNRPELNIKRGRLTLQHDTIAKFFTPSFTQIKKSVAEQLKGFQAEHIFLVGGYGESLHLRQMIKDTFESSTCQVTALDDGTAKAVSDGAVIWRCMKNVDGRRARFSYGAGFKKQYDILDKEQFGRTPIQAANGQLYINDYWSQIVKKNQLVKGTVYSPRHRKHANNIEDLGRFSWDVYSHDSEDPGNFLYNQAGRVIPGFKRLCTISADLKRAAKKSSRPSSAGSYYSVDVVIGMTFGDTEIKAALFWREGDAYRTGPAEVIPV